LEDVMGRISLLMAILLLLPLSAAHAEFFSWTDKNGNSYATDDLSKVPEAYRAQAVANMAPDEVNPGPAPKARDRQGEQAAPRSRERQGSSGDTHLDRYGRGEEYWHSRAESLRQEIDQLKQDRESSFDQERACEQKRVAYLGKTVDCSRYQVYRTQIERNIERARKRLEIDLPDEARKADAYPGWLR
jgi:hypothetical protein